MNQHLKLDGSHYDHREVDQLMSFLDTIEANVSKYFIEDTSGQQSLATDHDSLALMQVDKKGNFKLDNKPKENPYSESTLSRVIEVARHVNQEFVKYKKIAK